MKLRIEMDRVIAFHPVLAKVFGDIATAIYVQQLYYWSDKGEREDGYIYKTIKEIEEETTLTYKQQKRIRERLAKMGVLEIKKEPVKVSPVYLYKLNVEKLQELISAFESKNDEKPHEQKKELKLPKGKLYQRETLPKGNFKVDQRSTSYITENTYIDKNNKWSNDHHSDENIYEYIKKHFGKDSVGILKRNKVPLEFVRWVREVKKINTDKLNKPLIYIIGMAKKEETFAEFQRWQSEQDKIIDATFLKEVMGNG